MSTETPPSSGLSPSEREELLQLRAEVTRLRDQAAAASAEPVPGPRPGRGRRVARNTVASVLILISCLLAPLSVAAVWLRSEVADTNRYVETVEPLASDPAIQQAVTTDLTNIVFTYVDVKGITQQALTGLGQRGVLPPELATQLQALAGPVANGVRSFTQDRIQQVVQSDVFAQAWIQANRSAHEQLVAALTGQTGGGVTIKGNAVQVNLGPFLDVVKQRLVANGFDLAAKIPQVNATFTIFESEQVSKVQNLFNLLNTLGVWLPIVLLALAAIGIYVATNHRLAFIGTGLGLALSMLLGAGALAIAQRAYLNGVPPDVLPPDAATALFDTVVRFLRDAIRAAALIGLLVALGAFLTGPSVTAVTVRRWLVTGFAVARGGLANAGAPLTGATAWVAPRARIMRAILVTCALAVLAVVRYRTPGLVIWTTVGLLVGLAVVEFLAVEPRRRPPSAPVPQQASAAAPPTAPAAAG